MQLPYKSEQLAADSICKQLSPEFCSDSDFFLGTDFIMALTFIQPQLHSRIPLLTFGALQFCSGFATIWLDIAFFVLFHPHPAGMWPSVLFMITGCFGIRAGWRLLPGTAPWSRLPSLITSLILSILALMVSAIILAVWMALILEGQRFLGGSVGLSHVVNSMFAIQLFIGTVNFGQVVCTSVNIHKLAPGSVAPAPQDPPGQDITPKIEWMLTRSPAIYDAKN